MGEFEREWMAGKEWVVKFEGTYEEEVTVLEKKLKKRISLKVTNGEGVVVFEGEWMAGKGWVVKYENTYEEGVSDHEDDWSLEGVSLKVARGEGMGGQERRELEKE